MQIYTDAARDESISGLGWAIYLDDETISGNRYLTGNFTSMEAEYYALLDGLRFARRESLESVDVRLDCKPLVQKMRVPDDDKLWYDRRQGCHRLLNKFDRWTMVWVPRSSNELANRLAYEALEEGREA